MKTNTILEGDCLNLFKQLEDESIDCIVTSPPYNKHLNKRRCGRKEIGEYDMYSGDTVWRKDKEN